MFALEDMSGASARVKGQREGLGTHRANHMSRRLVMAVPMPTMVQAWMMAAIRCPSAAAQPKMMSHTTLAA